jgi:hypothetical protein
MAGRPSEHGGRPAGPSEAGCVERVYHAYTASAPSDEHTATPQEEPSGGYRGEGDESNTQASNNHLREGVRADGRTVRSNRHQPVSTSNI